MLLAEELNGATVLVIAGAVGLDARAQPDAARVALVIGNGDYVHAPPLPNPPNDARDVSARLRDLGFEVIEGLDLDRAAMEQLLRQFASRLEEGGVGLFFYAGHGLQVFGRNYLVPIDAQLDQVQDLYFEAIDLNLVLGLLEQESRTSLIFLDACRDNPLARNLSRTMGTGRSQAVGRGLAPVDSGIGTLIAYATQPNNVALDGSGDNSPFASAVLEYIDQPGLEVRQMLSRVRESVIRETGGRQVPWDNSSLTGDFYFVPEQDVATAREEPAPPAPPPEPVSDPQVEIIFWQAIQNSDNPEDFRAYLEKFPSGIFTLLARNRLRQLEGPDAVTDFARSEAKADEAPDEVEIARLDARESELDRREAELQRQRDALEAEWDKRLEELDQRLAARQGEVQAELVARAEALAAREQALSEQQQRLEQLEVELRKEREETQSEVREQISAAESRLKEAEKARERLGQQRLALEEEQAQLAERRAEIEALGAKQAKRMADLERDREALERAREELAARHKELASAPDPEQMAQMKAVLDARELELAQREAQLAEEQSGLATERSEALAALDRELESRQQAVEAELQTRAGDLELRESALRDRQQRLEQFAEEIAEAKEQNEAERQAQIAEAEAKLAAAAEERRRLALEREQLEKEEAQLAALRLENEANRAELEAMTAEQADRLAAIEQDRAALDHARAELERREEDIANAPDPADLARAKAALDMRAADLQARRSELGEEQRMLEAERSERLAALDKELAARQAAAERKLDERVAMLEARENSLATERAELAALEKEIARDREQGETIRQEQVLEAEAKLAAAEEERNRLADERDQLEDEQRRLAQLRSGDEQRREELARLEGEQIERLARLERDRAALELAQRELSERQVELASAPNPGEIQATQAELAAREAEIRRREEELAEDQQALESERNKQVAALDLQLDKGTASSGSTIIAGMGLGKSAGISPQPLLPDRPAAAEDRPDGPRPETGADPTAAALPSPTLRPSTKSEPEGPTATPGDAATGGSAGADDGEAPEAVTGPEESGTAGQDEGTEQLEVARLEPGQEVETPGRERDQAVVEPEEPLEILDAPYVATRNSNIRGGPSTNHPVVGFLPRGTELQVQGRVKGRDWYKVIRPDGGDGYVHAGLLSERDVQVARRSAAAAAERAERERAEADRQAELAEAARLKAEQEAVWERERKEAAELKAAREQMAAVQRQRDVEDERQRESSSAPTVDLPASSVFGAWCGNGITFRISQSSWHFRMADGFEVSFRVERVESDADIIRVYWFDGQGRRAVTEFGRFNEEKTQLVQLRGRMASADEWNEYNRPFQRC